MRVTSDTPVKVELISRHVEGELPRYMARLYVGFETHIIEDGEGKTRKSYECDMYVTDNELTFANDEEALTFYENNYDSLLRQAMAVEKAKLERQEEDKNRTALNYYDYVDHKTWEMFLKGSTLDEIREWIKKDKGADFLDEREKQRSMI